MHCSETNVTDTGNTPRLLVENTGCGIMSVSHTPKEARLRTLSIVGLGLGCGNLIQCHTMSIEHVHFTSVFKIMGNFQSHGQNRAQLLNYAFQMSMLKRFEKVNFNLIKNFNLYRKNWSPLNICFLAASLKVDIDNQTLLWSIHSI